MNYKPEQKEKKQIIDPTVKILTYFKNQKLNIIPLIKDKKEPAVQWEIYKEENFSFESLLEHYFENNYAVMCGSISNNLIVIDFDLPKKWKEAGNILTKEETNELYKKIVNSLPNNSIKTLVIKTPSGSLHFYFRLDSMESYKKLEKNKALRCKLKLNRVDISAVDIQGEGKYVVIPPSSFKNNYYEIFKKSPIQKINEETFFTFLSAWTTPIEPEDILKKKISKLRRPAQAIAKLEIKIEEYGIKHDRIEGAEFEYWDFFITECINNDFTNEEIHQLLKKQPNYKDKDTESHIQWVRRKGKKPYTDETLVDLFPEYPIVVFEDREKLYKIYEARTRKKATFKRDGKDWETDNFQAWYNNKMQEKYEKNLEDGNIDNLIKKLTNKTKESFIIKILRKIISFEPELINDFISKMAEKTNKEEVWFREQIGIIYIENLAKDNHIELNMLTITNEQIKLLASKLDLNRPASITGFFLALNIHCHFKRETICLTLLPNIEYLMNEIRKKYPLFVLDKTNDTYLYDKSGVYKRQNKKTDEIIEDLLINEIPFYIKQIVGDVFIIRRVKTIVKEIVLRSYIDENQLDFNILNFPNGLISLEDIKNKTWELKPHDPKYKSIIQFTIPFDFSIKESKIIKPFFLKQLGNEQYLLLMQLYGIALVGTPYKWKAITFLDGKTGTGKSDYIFKVLETIISQNYVSVEPLLSLISDKDDFATGSLLGSLINMHGDIGEQALSHPEGINRLTEEYISINTKYGYKGKIKNRCSHFYAMNVVPPIPNEERLDVFRRIEYLKIIGDEIPQNEQDPDFFKKIIEKYPNELIVLLNEMLLGLSEVLNKGTISSHPILEKREIYRQASLPLLSFIKKWCIQFETYKETKPSETYLIERHYFLEIYNQYRKELNIEKIENLWSLTEEEKKLPHNYKIYRIQKGTERFYKGIRFNNEAYKHFNINLEKVKELKIYYPEKTEYESTKQTKLDKTPKKTNNKKNIIDYSDPELLL